MGKKCRLVLSIFVIFLSVVNIALCSILISKLVSIDKPKQFYKDYLMSEIEICCFNNDVISYGTATCIDDNLFLTCAHVVLYDDGTNIYPYPTNRYRFADDETYFEFELIRYDIDKDIALIEINSDKDKKVKTNENVIYQVGDSVLSFGNAYNQGLSLSKGVISTQELLKNKVSYICSDNRVSHGCSGGGLFLENGTFIGMISSISLTGELVYSLSYKEILYFIRG